MTTTTRITSGIPAGKAGAVARGSMAARAVLAAPSRLPAKAAPETKPGKSPCAPSSATASSNASSRRACFFPGNGGSSPSKSYAGIEAIEGTRSFLVAPGTRVLLRFERPSGTTRLLMSVAQLYDTSLTPVTVRAMVAGGASIRDLELAVTEGPGFDPDVPGKDFYWDVVEEVEIPLDETGDDVLLVVDAPFSEGAASFRAGAWLDAVRFE